MVCIVTPSLPVKEASLIEVLCSEGWFCRYSTEPDPSALLLMKSTPVMTGESLLSLA